MKITTVDAFQIYDSRGIPTLEAIVTLEDGARGHGLVPSGASTGQFEALELRDGDKADHRGKTVRRAIENVRGEIADALNGRDVFDQEGLDAVLIALDGTPNKQRLGANAILGASMAAARAAANSAGVPLYHHLGGGGGFLLPLPEVQVIGGGAHANWRIDVQDFMIMAPGARTFPEALEITHNVYHSAGELLKQRGKFSGIADEGGYWPDFDSHDDVFDLLLQSIDRAGYRAGPDVSLSLDIAASDLYDQATETYRFHFERREYTRREFADLMIDWCDRYPVAAIEDPLADTDLEGWRYFTGRLGDRIQVIGDDLFTTNTARIRRGISDGLANSVLIKLNQIGTVSETIQAIRLTREAGWAPVVSARSGETEDAFISHLAVATNAGQLKVGSFARSERMVKWNECLRIERMLGDKARFGPRGDTRAGD